MKNSIKKSDVVVVDVVEVLTVKLGRKVNPNSVRQIRLKELEAKKAAGGGKQGRPVVEGSARQLRLKVQAENKAKGMKQGRPVKEGSARQLRLAELKAKAEANGGTVKRGRPAAVKVETIESKGDEVAA